MPIRYETLQNGDRLPLIGLGTWNMGGGNSSDYSHDEETVQAIQTAIRLGLTHIDTAEGYADGHSEELVGRAARDFKRSDLFITTKVSARHLRYDDVFNSLSKSLKRLEIDYVDQYLIHWPSTSIPLKETFRALNELVEQGTVRHVGVSNFDLDLLKQSQALCNSPIATNQVPYSLFTREYAENGVLEHCQQTGVLFVAYTPIEVDKVFRNRVVSEVARSHNVTVAQVALAWLIRQPKVITIPKSVSEAHLREDVAAYDLNLTADEVSRLDGLA
jgi:diketogulonate reductase-like aldo/keto reductase